MRSALYPQATALACFVSMALFTLPSAFAQTANDPMLADLASQSREAANTPAMALMRLQDGEVRIGVSGLRDSGADVEATPDDLWHIGSNTKSMTATLVARLVEDGVVSWDDTVDMHLGNVVEGIHPDFADVTFRHLLSHHAGLKANVGTVQMMGFHIEGEGGRPLPEQRLDYARHVLSRAPESTPGTQFLYSNAGYVVAGAMIEQATGEAWSVLLAREVFEPLGIEAYGFGAPGSADVIDQPRGHAQGLLGGLSSRVGERGDNPPVLGPAGTVHISLPDYALYLQAHIDGGRGVDSEFLSAESWRVLHEQAFTTPYSMGWGLGSDELQHSGSNTLWMMHAVIVPDQNFGAVIAMNSADTTSAGPVFRAISDAD